MTRRPVRWLILLVAILVTGAAAWRATVNERMRVRERAAADSIDTAAARAQGELAELRATLHAYVALGQDRAFWAQRAQALFDSSRATILDIDGPATLAGHPLAAQAIGPFDKLAALERRAREAVQQGQLLLAGDMIFIDARDLIRTITEQLGSARQAIARAASSVETGITNEQSLLAGAVLAAWLVAAILLVPLPEASAVSRLEPSARPGALDLPLESVPAAQTTGFAVPPSQSDGAPERTAAVSTRPSEPVPPQPALLGSLAEICSGFGRVSEAADLDALLERSARLLGASGLVVWVLGPNHESLIPGTAFGYGPDALARIGPVPLSADNLTTAAFRNATVKHRRGVDQAPGAVAAPLVSSSGPIGVLTAEIVSDTDPETIQSLAAVLAAQLATLFASPPASTVAEAQQAQG